MRDKLGDFAERIEDSEKIVGDTILNPSERATPQDDIKWGYGTSLPYSTMVLSTSMVVPMGQAMSFAVPPRQQFRNHDYYYNEVELSKKLKNYSQEKFKKMGKEPIVKEIMAGLAKIPKEDIRERVNLHLEQIG